MRIGINGLLLSGRTGYRRTGVSRYIECLAAALPAAMPEAELLIYTGRGVEFPHARPAPVPMERPRIRVAWEQGALPLLVRRDHLDLFHGTVNTVPWGLGSRTVVTIHDLAFLRWPEQVPARRYRYLARAIPAAVRRADRVLTVSEATKRDLVELLGADPARIAVTPLGVEGRFRPRDPATIARFRAEHELDQPFLLAVGTLEPRKNLPRLLEAFASVVGAIPHRLVLVGPEGWLTGPLHERLAALGLGDRVRLTGYVPDDALPLWYGAAAALVFPSLYEGFGLPALEAMACGTPVLASDRAALPEVTGGAALLVDPESVESIAEGICALATDPGPRDRLRAAGLTRAAAFAWERTARLTAAAYREALR